MTWIKIPGPSLVNLNHCTVIRIEDHTEPNKGVVTADDKKIFIGTLAACETFIERLSGKLEAQDAKSLGDEKRPIGSGKIPHGTVTLGKR